MWRRRHCINRCPRSNFIHLLYHRNSHFAMTAFLRLFTSTTVTKVNPQSFNSVLAQPCVFIAIPTEDKKAKRAT